MITKVLPDMAGLYIQIPLLMAEKQTIKLQALIIQANFLLKNFLNDSQLEGDLLDNISQEEAKTDFEYCQTILSFQPFFVNLMNQISFDSLEENTLNQDFKEMVSLTVLYFNKLTGLAQILKTLSLDTTEFLLNNENHKKHLFDSIQELENKNFISIEAQDFLDQYAHLK
jgi:hypothetical protein